MIPLLRHVFRFCSAAQCRQPKQLTAPKPLVQHLRAPAAPGQPPRTPTVHVHSRDNGKRGLGAPPLPAAARALRPPPSRVLVPAAAAARLFSLLRASRCWRRRRLGRRRALAGARR